MPYRISLTINKKRLLQDRVWKDKKSARKQAHFINTNNPGFNARIVKSKRPYIGNKPHVCTVCMGSGKLLSSRFRGMGYSHSIEKCSRCKGTGKIIPRTEKQIIAERKRREAIKKANIKRLKKK